MRESTEWTETIELGANVLVGSDSKRIIKAAREIIEAEDSKVKLEGLVNPFGNGQVSQRIVAETLKMK